MSALTAGRVTVEWAPGTVKRNYKMLASTQIWEGGIVVANASGYAIPAVSGIISTGVEYKVLGIAQESKLSAAASNPYIEVHAAYATVSADSAFALTALGQTAYLVDDQTVSVTSTNRSTAGTVAAVDDNGNPTIKFGI